MIYYFSGTGNSYANLTTTSEMAEVFSNVFSSSILKKRIVEELELQEANFAISDGCMVVKPKFIHRFAP